MPAKTAFSRLERPRWQLHSVFFLALSWRRIFHHTAVASFVSFIFVTSFSIATFYSSHLTKMVARLFATSSRTALKAAKANLALNRGLATAAPAVGKVKYVSHTISHFPTIVDYNAD